MNRLWCYKTGQYVICHDRAFLNSLRPHKIFFAGFALFVFMFFAGCATHHGVTVLRYGQPPVNCNGDTSLLPKGLVDFTISPGDVYRVDIRPASITTKLFKIEANTTMRLVASFGSGAYHIMEGDQIRVDFVTDSSLNFDATVRPDGKITIPKIGEVMARGKTAGELARTVTKACEAKVNDPRVTVSLTGINEAPINDITGDFTISPDGKLIVPILGEVEAAGLTPQELSKKLTKLARRKFANNLQIDVVPRNFVPTGLVGYDRTVTVTPSGEIMLPAIGNIKVEGNTLPELRDKLRKSMQKYYANPIDISITLISSAKRVVYVSGEVKIPGSYPLANSMTLLKAIMEAGGVTPEGDLSSVVLIHYGKNEELTIYKSNLEEVLEKNLRFQDLALSSQDVIYVPKTGISKANQFIDQYINKMLPFSKGVNYNYNQNRDPSF